MRRTSDAGVDRSPRASSTGWRSRPVLAGWTSAAAPGALTAPILERAAPSSVARRRSVGRLPRCRGADADRPAGPLRGRRRGALPVETDRSTSSSPASSSTSSRTSRAALTEMRRRRSSRRHRGGLRLGLRRTDGPAPPVLRRGDRRRSAVPRRTTRAFASRSVRPDRSLDAFEAAGFDGRRCPIRSTSRPIFATSTTTGCRSCGGVGPASGYAVSLDPDAQAALRERLRATLPTAADGSIDLIARAWAVQGRA